VRGEDLDGAQGRVEVRFVPGVGCEGAGVGDPAREDPLEHVVAREGVCAAEEGEGGEAPVDAVHAEVLGVVVGEVVALLRAWFERCELSEMRLGAEEDEEEGERRTLSRD